MKLALLGSRTSESNWRDIYACLRGAPYTDVVAPEQKRIAFDKQYRRFGEPIYFPSGRFDNRADSGLAEAYLSALDAPHKGFVWFESSAHSPPFEQPEEFDAWIVTHFDRNSRAVPLNPSLPRKLFHSALTQLRSVSSEIGYRASKSHSAEFNPECKGL